MARSLHPSQLQSYDICCVSKSDPGIRLFGKMILAPESAAGAQSVEFPDGCHVECDEDGLSPRGVDDLGTSYGSGSASDDDNNPSCAIDEGNGNSELPDSLKKMEVGADTIHPEEDTFRKPDKPIPCPRCDSLDTKFCYFNNYNVNQPRHFCKHCQRYWTTGGTLRNVPVGAGKRKSKQSSVQQRQIAHSPHVVNRRDYPGDAEPLHSSSRPAQMEHMTSVFRSPYAGTQLTTSVVENGPTGSSLSNNSRHSTPFVGSVLGMSGDAGGTQWLKGTRDSARDQASHVVSQDVSSVYLSNSHKEMNCKAASSTPVPAALMEGVCDSSSQISSCDEALPSCAVPETWCGAQVLPVFGGPWPCLYWTGIPSTPKLLACPSAGDVLWKWGQCPTPVWTLQGWTFPCTNLQPWSISHEPIPASVDSRGSSTALGKRPVEETLEGSSSLGTPKTLKIHDAEAAAHSSIFTTLDGGTKHQASKSGGFFNALQTEAGSWKIKSERKNFDEEALRIGHSNPAARSRSHEFQQTT